MTASSAVRTTREPRRIATRVFTLALPILLSACATFGHRDEVPDHTVTIEVANRLAAYGELTIWVYAMGQFEQLGTVPAGETRAFAYQLRWTGNHTLVAHRPGFTPRPTRAGGPPPGELVASSQRFDLNAGVERVVWDTTGEYVRVEGND